MTSTKSSIFALLAASLWISCGKVSTEENSLKIVGGQPLETNQTPAVALLKYDGLSEYYTYCSGVLIAPRFVVTAAHCHQPDFPLAHYRIAIKTAKPDTNHSASYSRVAKVVQYPDFKPNAMRRARDGVFRPTNAGDIGLWELEDAVLDVKPAVIATPSQVDLYLRSGELFFIMGFGKKQTWESDWVASQLSMAVIPYAETSTQVSTDLTITEHLTGKKSRPVTIDSRSHHEFFLGGPGLPDSCKGDSGGPVFVKERGTEAALLVGLTSRGTSTCNGGGIYTLLAPKLGWLAEFGALPTR